MLKKSKILTFLVLSLISDLKAADDLRERGGMGCLFKSVAFPTYMGKQTEKDKEQLDMNSDPTLLIVFTEGSVVRIEDLLGKTLFYHETRKIPDTDLKISGLRTRISGDLTGIEGKWRNFEIEVAPEFRTLGYDYPVFLIKGHETQHHLVASDKRAFFVERLDARFEARGKLRKNALWDIRDAHRFISIRPESLGIAPVPVSPGVPLERRRPSQPLPEVYPGESASRRSSVVEGREDAHSADGSYVDPLKPGAAGPAPAMLGQSGGSPMPFRTAPSLDREEAVVAQRAERAPSQGTAAGATPQAAREPHRDDSRSSPQQGSPTFPPRCSGLHL